MNNSWLDRHRHLVFLILVLVAAAGAGIFYLRQPASEPIEVLPVEATATATAPPTSTPSPVRVYVSGAVVNSDVYFLPQGSIVKDAILAAGGFTSDADQERINQALELKDQQQIHVPRLGEDDKQPVVSGGPDSENNQADSNGVPGQQSVVNINTANVEQLDSLPGIGPAIAQRIIDYRETIGSFQSVEQITEVKGVGEATFDNIKNLITAD